MRTPEAEGLSDKARQLLTEMLNSGNAQQVYVAQALDEIASNGEGQETDEFLHHCAHEIACEAALVAKSLKDREDKPDDLGDPEAVVDLLLLVDVEVELAEVQKWTLFQREQAAKWAGAVHLSASDNDDVEVPPCPSWVPPDETAKRLAERTTTGEDGYNWRVFKLDDVQKPIGNIHLPSFFDASAARRFAYQKFKAQLRGVEHWDVH